MKAHLIAISHKYFVTQGNFPRRETEQRTE